MARDGLYKQTKSKYWYASYINKSGERIRRSTGQTDKSLAKKILAEWITTDSKRAIVQLRTFDELLLAYLKAGRTLKGKEKSPKTLNAEKYFISTLYDFFSGYFLLPKADEKPDKEKVLDSIAIQSYIEFRREQGKTESTIKRELAVLSSAISYANKYWEWQLADPTEKRKPSQNHSRIRWITKEEALKLIDIAKKSKHAPYLADWLIIALNTGCRRDELSYLKWERVDFANSLIYLDENDNKSKKKQAIPLNQSAKTALLSRKNWKDQYCPYAEYVFVSKDGTHIKSIRKAFSNACQKAGITNFTPHDCRHTFASWLIQDGIPITVVKELLRHSSVKTTEIYAHLSPDAARQGVENLNIFGKEETVLRMVK